MAWCRRLVLRKKREGDGARTRLPSTVGRIWPSAATWDICWKVSDAKTIRYARCGLLLLLAHGSSPPAQNEWAEYVEVLGEAHRGGTRGLLVLTDGPGPNSMQRKMVSSFDLRSAVLTPSQVARGIVTALGWFGANIRAFIPEQIDDALKYLEVPSAEQQTVLRVLAGLRYELAGKPATLVERMSARELHEVISSSLEAIAQR